MNRRDFLSMAAQASVGATGLIMLSNESAASILSEGKAILTEADIKDTGKIITKEEYINEVVDMARFGDQLADLLMNASGPISFHLMEIPGGKRVFRVYGKTTPSHAWKDYGNTMLVQGDTRVNFVGHNRGFMDG